MALKHKFLNLFFAPLDAIYRKTDRKQVLRTYNITRIPKFRMRRGGKTSYAEWAHIIGIFQTTFYNTLKKKKANHILDIGCGSGLLGMAAEPFVQEGGSYTGLEIQKSSIDFNKQNYTPKWYNFIHFDLDNPTYTKGEQSTEMIPWPVDSGKYDLLSALSVWTHLKEEQAIFYFKEVARVLKPGGRAVITFFYLDQAYYDTVDQRQAGKNGRYHASQQMKWVYDVPAYGSNTYFTARWVQHPEDAIGVNEEAMQVLLKESGLKMLEFHPGHWREVPGLYMQDVLIFEKPE